MENMVDILIQCVAYSVPSLNAMLATVSCYTLSLRYVQWNPEQPPTPSPAIPSP